MAFVHVGHGGGTAALASLLAIVVLSVRLVIAGPDPVAADCVGARLLGFRAQAVRHLWEAGRLGLGETDTDRMDFPALALRDAIGAFTEAAYGRRLTFEHA